VKNKGKYSVVVSNWFAALEDLDAKVEINSAWVTIGENIKISAKEILDYYESKKHNHGQSNWLKGNKPNGSDYRKPVK
jgi:restriction endonuclease S subunit